MNGKSFFSKLQSTSLAAVLLRVGLAIVFLYAAISALRAPDEWVGYLPTLLTQHFDATLVLHFFSVYELILAALLLSGWWVRWVALLVAATFAGILLSDLRDLIISFRDIGLLFAALALAALPSDKQK